MYHAGHVILLFLFALSVIRLCSLLIFVLMSNACKNWSVLCWNVRGLNSDARQRAVRQKLDESQCAIACFQETKCASFDFRSIRSFSLKYLIVLLSPPLLELLGEFWLFGTPLFSGAL